MIPPKETKNEEKRLQELLSYDILNTEVEEDFDNLTKLAAEICGTKIALVSLIDDQRQWFKSACGLNVKETTKEIAFCGHALHQPDQLFLVKDAREDKRFHDNPLVTGDPYIVFYAGVPLLSESGLPLGTLCVIDDKPKVLTEAQVQALKILSRQVMNLIDLRKKKHQLNEKNDLLERKNEEIEGFAHTAAHDLKSPLHNIIFAIDLLKKMQSIKDEEIQSLHNVITRASEKLASHIDQLLEFSKIDKISTEDEEEINLEALLEELKSIIAADSSILIRMQTNLTVIQSNKAGVMLILLNLITNAVKYGDKPTTRIDIGIEEESNAYKFIVKDNGPGIATHQKEKAFEPYEIIAASDKFGKKGTGLGLANVKKAVEKLGGSISLTSTIGEGTIFTFTIKKNS
ncbi:MAG: GAF domain-containing sensor histidine kinase [Fulvivirga sp.]|nr:GAF domain-containing sensor histidine kinase [Fulvivirga sp.]